MALPFRQEILVLYATQTGTAHEVAEDICRALIKNRFSIRLVSFSDYPIQNLRKEKYVVFVVSTAGQGDFPDSAKLSWTFLRRADLPPTSLNGINIAVFGLGDSSYSRFNLAGKLLYARLMNLGASSLIERGDGDDQHRFGLYGALMPWIDQLISKLSLLYPLPTSESIIESSELPPPRYKIHFGKTKFTSFHKALSTIKLENIQNKSTQYNQSHPYISYVLDNERITSTEWDQDVRNLSLEIPQNGTLKWQPGDVVYIQPLNFDEEVDNLLSYLSLDGELMIEKIETIDQMAPNFEICNISVRELLTRFLDICGTPRRYFFELLSYFATDSSQSEKLKFLSSREGQEDMNDYARKSRRTFLDVFKDFDSAQPSLDYLLDLIPKLGPRAFSISSSYNLNPQKLEISMVVVRYKSSANRLRRGVCSTWLANQINNHNGSVVPVPIWVKSGTMALPENPKTPIIMIGPGTGCAIFRSFLQERLHYIQSHKQHVNSDEKNHLYQYFGESLFYFGCRKESMDFLYKDLWLTFLNENVLSQLSVAFSQDKRAIRMQKKNKLTKEVVGTETNDNKIELETQEYNVRAVQAKMYVQDCVIQDSSKLWDLIDKKGASIFVCGSANKMPADVRKAFVKVIINEGGRDEVQADTYLRNMEARRRYCVESWS